MTTELTDIEQRPANLVALRGTISGAPTARVLPSGAEIVSFRCVVPRAQTAMTKGSQQRSDWFGCTAWTAATRRAVSGWVVGDEVIVEGALRRRHFAGGTSVEIEVFRARRAPPTRSALPD